MNNDRSDKPWALLWDCCQNPQCDTPHLEHQARGWCRGCYTVMRYRTDPEFRARQQKHAKTWDLTHTGKKPESIRAWKARNPSMVQASSTRHHAKVKRLTGQSSGAKWKPGTSARFATLMPGETVIVTRAPRRLDGEMVVDVRLGSGSELLEVPTRCLIRLGFSLEDVA